MVKVVIFFYFFLVWRILQIGPTEVCDDEEPYKMWTMCLFSFVLVSSLNVDHHGGFNFSKRTRDSTMKVVAKHLCWHEKWLWHHIKLKLRQSNQQCWHSCWTTYKLHFGNTNCFCFFVFSTQPLRQATATNHLWSTVTWPAAIARGQWELWWSLPATLDTLWNRAQSPLNVWTLTIPSGMRRSLPAEVCTSLHD